MDNKIRITIDEDKVLSNWSEARIQGFMTELGFSRLETILYLWAYNNISISPDDRDNDLGRPMYRKFAQGFGQLLKTETQGDSDAE